jgi:hypothetical protein
MEPRDPRENKFVNEVQEMTVNHQFVTVSKLQVAEL